MCSDSTRLPESGTKKTSRLTRALAIAGSAKSSQAAVVRWGPEPRFMLAKTLSGKHLVVKPPFADTLRRLLSFHVMNISSILQPASTTAVLAFAALTALGMLAGVAAMRRFEATAVKHSAELVAFAAGLLVSGALLHLISRAVELAGLGAGFAWTLAGFLAFYLLEAHFIPHVHARGDSAVDEFRPPNHSHRMGSLVIGSLAVHSVVDGISVGAGLTAGTLVGSVTVILVVVHKLPVGIAAMSALYHSGVPGRRAGWITTGLALVTPVAVVATYFALRDVSGQVLGILLALAGGSFLYVGAADLLPEGQARGRLSNTVMFFFGAALMATIKLLIL